MGKSYSSEILYGLLFLIIVLAGAFFGNITGHAVGENVEVNTRLTVGESYPAIKDLSLSEDIVVLTPNSKKRVYCSAILEDFNGENDLDSLNVVMYSSASTLESADDKNNHYTSSDCEIQKSFSKFGSFVDDEYHALANCAFDLEFFADSGDWTCFMEVKDKGDLKDSKEKSFDVMELLALGLPSAIDYGAINATYVSSEREIGVINYGNVRVNLALSGYGSNYGDGYAMKCDLGEAGIPVGYQKYNLEDSVPGVLSFSEFEGNYNNLTRNSLVKSYGLNSRDNDEFNDAVDFTYWRIYVPRGVAGTCSGNIVIGAVKG